MCSQSNLQLPGSLHYLVLSEDLDESRAIRPSFARFGVRRHGKKLPPAVLLILLELQIDLFVAGFYVD
jgi:hypothetical protein